MHTKEKWFFFSASRCSDTVTYMAFLLLAVSGTNKMGFSG